MVSEITLDKARSHNRSYYGTQWRHLKTGGVYRIRSVGVHTETGELMVTYEGRTGHWVRPFSMFMDGRFTRID